MPRKLLISEAFEDSSKEIVLTVRVPGSLYSLLEKEAQEQGSSISTLVRGLLNYHYLADHLKSKLKKRAELTSNEVGLLESLRSHTQNIINQLDEIDTLRGPGLLLESRSRQTKRGLKKPITGGWLEKLIEKKIGEAISRQEKGRAK